MPTHKVRRGSSLCLHRSRTGKEMCVGKLIGRGVGALCRQPTVGNLDGKGGEPWCRQGREGNRPGNKPVCRTGRGVDLCVGQVVGGGQQQGRDGRRRLGGWGGHANEPRECDRVGGHRGYRKLVGCVQRLGSQLVRPQRLVEARHRPRKDLRQLSVFLRLRRAPILCV